MERIFLYLNKERILYSLFGIFFFNMLVCIIEWDNVKRIILYLDSKQVTGVLLGEPVYLPKSNTFGNNLKFIAENQEFLIYANTVNKIDSSETIIINYYPYIPQTNLWKKQKLDVPPIGVLLFLLPFYLFFFYEINQGINQVNEELKK